MNRSFTARLSASTPRRMRDYLWATHRLFNESLAYLLKHYFWMQNLTDRDVCDDGNNRLRRRFSAVPEQLDRLRLVYLDMMGLPGSVNTINLEGIPKDKRAGRSQSAPAWLEPITFSSGSTGEGPGESSKNIHAEVKSAIRQLRKGNQWLFDRELALPVTPDNGFRRGLFGVAARRILNFEQNEDTHRGYKDDAERAFDRWTGGLEREEEQESADTRRAGWKRSVLTRAWKKGQLAEREAELDEIGKLTWSDFENAQREFETYQRKRAEKRAIEHGQPVSEATVEPLNGAMTRGWRDIYERLRPPDSAEVPVSSDAQAIIKDYQKAQPRRIGDVNFFLWLADKPHLWRFVETMRRYNDLQRKLNQYSKPIQFRYPRYDRRPEWFTFSETSPGHMYTIVSMSPLVIELRVFVPREDAPILKKLAENKPLSESEMNRLNQPIDWEAYHLTKAGLAARCAGYRAALEKAKPGLIAKAKLDDAHAWTDAVWAQLIDGFFRDRPPLDLSKFERVMVRYTMTPDARLAAKGDVGKRGQLGRLVVVREARQESKFRLISRSCPTCTEIQAHPGGRRPPSEKWPHEQGLYEYWFGPLVHLNVDTEQQLRYLRPMPLVFGGMRLEYPGRQFGPTAPRFTMSCELDEARVDAENRRIVPTPAHRIRAAKVGKPLKRDGWIERSPDIIVCRFRHRGKMAAVGSDAGLVDDFPLPGVRLIRGKPAPSARNHDPYPVVVEAEFNKSNGWRRKAAGDPQDPGRYVEDWVNEGSSREFDPGLRGLFIDLGMRHIACGAVVEFVDDGNGNGILPDPLKPIAVEFLNVPGVTLSHIQRHQDERRRKQRQACPRGARKSFEVRGTHLPRGQDFAKRLLDHAENLKDDRRKKAANAILIAALDHRVDYIVFENLKGYRPDVEFGRRVNSALMKWNRRELVEFVKMEAAPFGIHIYEFVPPHHTSRFCHRCGAVGHRFTHISNTHASKDMLAPMRPTLDKSGAPLLDASGQQVCRRVWTPAARRVRGTPLGLIAGMRQSINGGQQFCCAECKLIVNADYNAAMNLARKLANDFPAYEKYSYNAENKTWVFERGTLPTAAFWEHAKARIQQILNQRFKQPIDTPPAGGWPADWNDDEWPF